MYDAKWILPGLAIFAILASFPLWFTSASGKLGYRPEPKPPVQEKACIEPKAVMRTRHGELLAEWKDAAFERRSTPYTASDGKTYPKSLWQSCMRCHTDRAVFCDQCHTYAGVASTARCWSCHDLLKGPQAGTATLPPTPVELRIEGIATPPVRVQSTGTP